MNVPLCLFAFVKCEFFSSFT